jgi:hypothetical protein
MLRGRFHLPSCFACLVVLASGVTLLRGDEQAAPTALQVAQWIKDLDSDEFTVRQQASSRLIAAGKQAVGQVAKAAEGDSAEVRTRCFDVLIKLQQSSDAETKAEAKKALTDLTKSKNTDAARQAERLVNPSKPASGETPRDPLIPGAGAPRVEIRGFGVAGGMRASVKTAADGSKTIEVEEGGKKTKIEETAKGEIKLEITETVDGKEKSSKFEAKTAEELKKNHPEAHKLYEKYAKMGPGAAIRFGAIGPAIAPVARPIRIGAIPQKALDQMEEAKRQLDDATDKLRKLAEESRITPEQVKKLAEQVEAAKKQLEEARAQLPK